MVLEEEEARPKNQRLGLDWREMLARALNCHAYRPQTQFDNYSHYCRHEVE
jgi:hypothetical protein